MPDNASINSCRDVFREGYMPSRYRLNTFFLSPIFRKFGLNSHSKPSDFSVPLSLNMILISTYASRLCLMTCKNLKLKYCRHTLQHRAREKKQQKYRFSLKGKQAGYYLMTSLFPTLYNYGVGIFHCMVGPWMCI